MVTQRSKVFADLDALTVEDTHFKYMGESWRIRPITTKNFMEFSNATAEINLLLKKDTKTVTIEQVDQAYINLFTSVIENMTEELVLKMNVMQRAALMNLIVDHVQGRIQGEAEGKKDYPRIGKSGKFISPLRG